VSLPFHGILQELLRTTEGSLGAMFLDYEGETVALLTEHDLDADDLRIIGAYQGIFLDRLKKLCGEIDAGRPERFKLEFANAKILSCDLKDGYYAVLLLRRDANEGVAWHRLGCCREKLMQEM
jgi:predicted regulator of Ras-like GTPase activity (Roadblock/LC7/MglB family)